MMLKTMSFIDACNESDDLHQELTRVDGQSSETEAATVASLAVDVATHRSTQQRLEGTLARLQNEATGKPLYRATLFGSFLKDCMKE